MSEGVTIISQEQMAALLGRSLSATETANFGLYCEIAVLRLEDLLCIDLSELTELPADLKLLIARCFEAITLEQAKTANNGVSSKKVEDFSISYFEKSDSPMGEFVRMNGAILEKYGRCQAPIRSGKVLNDCLSTL